MSRKAPLLFTPIVLGGVSYSNRIHVSPMCQYSADNGCATDWHLAHCVSLANSGASLFVFEATAVEPRGRISADDLGLFSDDCETALGRVVTACGKYGLSKLGIQLAHAGRKASVLAPWKGSGTDRERGWVPIAPSSLTFSPHSAMPTEMTLEDIRDVKAAFVRAAERAVRLGLDEIEVHAAHGYLLHQFMSPLSNVRTDEYGGSFEHRIRFPLEIVQAVRQVVPRDKMTLGIRISGNDWKPGSGLTEEDAAEFAKVLVDQGGVDFICVSSGGIVSDARYEAVPGYQLPFAARVKQAVSVPVRAVGMITTGTQAEEILQTGQADLVAIARGFLDNPHWAWQAAADLGTDVARPPQYDRSGPRAWPGHALHGQQ